MPQRSVLFEALLVRLGLLISLKQGQIRIGTNKRKCCAVFAIMLLVVFLTLFLKARNKGVFRLIIDEEWYGHLN